MSTKLTRIADGLMEAAWLAAVVIAPVFFNVFSSRIFEPDKITAIRSLAVLILAAWILKLLEQRQVRWTKLKPGANLFQTIKETPLLMPVVLMALSYVISTIFSVSWATSLYGSYQRLQGTYTFFSYLIIFAAVAANLRKRAQVDRLMLTVILSSLPVSLYGILQRFHLDPIPWGGDTTVRVASNMGNSIFVSAYLIMAIPLVIGKLISAFRAIWIESERQAMHVVRGTLYLVILIMQLITIYFSQSRGPMLGLLAGLYILALLLSFIWKQRWLTYTILAVSVLGGGFLLLLNIHGGPLESIRTSPLVGRFGTLLDTESNTAKVRYYIWLGASKLVMPHDPIEYPDGSKDALNVLRPLIGYGPESMYVAYNPFYEPMLGHVERRNASPDRSHNETWDSLVTMGLFGFLTYIGLFSTAIYFGLKWLGLIESRRNTFVFWGLLVAGGLVGAVAVVLWNGLPYLGVGLPFGMIVGLLIYITISPWMVTYYRPATSGEVARATALAVLLAAIIAHWVEINFGIAIVSTRIHFWVYLALLFTVGLALPMHGEYGGMSVSPADEPAPWENQAQEYPAQDAVAGKNRQPSPRRTKKQAGSASASSARQAPGRQSAGHLGAFAQTWWFAALTNGLVLGLLSATLGYDYITNPERNTSALQIVTHSFTYLSSNGGAPSYALVGMLFVALLAGAFLFSAENETVKDIAAWLKASLVTFGVAFILMFVYSLIHAGRLGMLAAATIQSEAELIDQVNSLGGLVSVWYFYIFLILAAAAFLLNPPLARSQASSGMGFVFAPVLLLVALVVVNVSNLKIIHADVAFKMAEPFTNGTQWPIATRMYNHAISLAPNEDYYYLFIGRSYLEQAKQLTSVSDQAAVVAQADADLKAAQKINPLNTDHTANLARLYSWWATKATNEEDRAGRGQISADYYARALALSRNSASLMGEAAVVYLNLLSQPEKALELLQKAMALDPQYPFIQSMTAEYYMYIGRTQQVPQLKIDNYEKAITYYQAAIDTSIGRDAGSELSYAIAIGNAYLELATLDSANIDKDRLLQSADAFQTALKYAVKAADITRIEEQLGRIYIQLADKPAALQHLQNSLAAAADADKDRLNQLINQVTAMP